MSHKHSFSLGGHSVTSDIGGGHIVKEIRTILVSSCRLKKDTSIVAFHFMKRQLKNKRTEISANLLCYLQGCAKITLYNSINYRLFDDPLIRGCKLLRKRLL